MIVVYREEKHSETEERDNGVVIQIKGLPCIENEKDCQLSPIEGEPLHPIITLRTDSTSNPRPCVRI
jgi:hypothetical protein